MTSATTQSHLYCRYHWLAWTSWSDNSCEELRHAHNAICRITDMMSLVEMDCKRMGSSHQDEVNELVEQRNHMHEDEERVLRSKFLVLRTNCQWYRNTVMRLLNHQLAFLYAPSWLMASLERVSSLSFPMASLQASIQPFSLQTFQLNSLCRMSACWFCCPNGDILCRVQHVVTSLRSCCRHKKTCLRSCRRHKKMSCRQGCPKRHDMSAKANMSLPVIPRLLFELKHKIWHLTIELIWTCRLFWDKLGIRVSLLCRNDRDVGQELSFSITYFLSSCSV